MYDYCVTLSDILKFTCNYNFEENARDDLKRSFAKMLIDIAKKVVIAHLYILIPTLYLKRIKRENFINKLG